MDAAEEILLRGGCECVCTCQRSYADDGMRRFDGPPPAFAKKRGFRGHFCAPLGNRVVDGWDLGVLEVMSVILGSGVSI